MSLKFYFAPWSTAGITEAVLNELERGQSKLAERIEVSFKNGDTRKQEYLDNVNPNGLVPVIVHDGVSIWESAAITIYLGDLYGVERKLYPEPGPRRGEAMKWIVWSNVSLATQIGRYGEFVNLDSSKDQTEAEKQNKKMNYEAASKEMDKLFGILDNALKGKDYLLGDMYTLADTHIWSFMGYLDMLKYDREKFANVKAWTERVGARPALKDVK
ncbi:glutathione S-transferase [Thamnocephalis sphaerospora]|uniref:Glutathione S-transferase n=1 Tax=Thamnocephalis sphaerospora TaxID=78915 RepID=A0A4P9XGF0_9FUNG|nr:glutathione S-transferase [Thamnocephalis sphaerospora]|eukprot:RKP04658.1 glutathione S-transferase [Thamnocephalis sphaerospora]